MLEKHYCEKGSIHTGKQILFICMQQDCKDNRLCCLSCIDEQHQKHQIVSVSKFTRTLNTKLQGQNQNYFKGKIYKMITECEEWFMQKLKQVESLFLNQIQQCEDQITKYFLNLHQAFATPSAEEVLITLNNQFTNDKINELLNCLNAAEKHKFGTAKQTEHLIEYEKDIFRRKVDKLKNKLKLRIKRLVDDFDSVKIAGTVWQDDVKFDTLKKSFSLSISDAKDILKKRNSQGGRPIAVADRRLDPINNRVCFKIVSNGIGTKSICVGVCLLNVVRSANYINSIGLNKGTYGIDQCCFSGWGVQQSNVAYTVNHISQEHNNKNLGFQIQEGSYVMVEINYLDSMLEISTDEEIYQMPIDLYESRDIYPFVSLTNQGAVVSIFTDWPDQ